MTCPLSGDPTQELRLNPGFPKRRLTRGAGYIITNRPDEEDLCTEPSRLYRRVQPFSAKGFMHTTGLDGLTIDGDSPACNDGGGEAAPENNNPATHWSSLRGHALRRRSSGEQLVFAATIRYSFSA